MVLTWLWNGKLLILFFILVFAGASALYVDRAIVPIYRATSKIMITSQQEQVVDLESVVSGLASSDTVGINSEVEVLLSLSLLGKVVDRLDLTEDPEFNTYIREPGAKAQLKARIYSMIGLDIAERSMPDAETVRGDTTVNLRRAISVRNISNTLVFDLRAESVSPTKAALIANTLADVYIMDQIDVKYEATQRATGWLSTRVAELQTALEDAEAAVKNFRGNIDLVSQESLLAQERQLKDVRERLEGLNETLAAASERLASLQEAETYPEKAEVSRDPQLRDLLARIDDPNVQAMFDSRYENLVTRTGLEQQQQQQQRIALEESKQKLSEQIDRQSEDFIRLQQLTREAEASRLLYEYFLTRLKETSAQEGILQADSRILSPALVPKLPSAPDTQLIISMWGILGAVVGTALVILRHMAKTTVLTSRELEAMTGISTFGQVPKITARRRIDFVKYCIDKPTSEVAEAIRNIRTSIMLSNMDHEPKVIAMTSALPSEGKTSLSIALAQNVRGLGKKCLVIEGDVRRRIMTQTLSGKSLQSSQGIISALTGEQSLRDAVVYNELIDCDILQAEKTNVSAADIFSSKRFQNLLSEAREIYDFIIIDTPPVLLVTDTRIILQHVDASIFVVAWNQTTKQQVQEAIGVLESSNIRVSGLIFNKINRRTLEKMGYGTDYGKYGRNYYNV
ncbi:capsular exopolysaccharide family [Puniceibacterium sediminis]|uniref:non-specific protein-tyrosine kinase n=2 Tax=Puniceibacterium sediminis TaxID=1608407 RepID=A0A238ZYA3_9RHOB|nr:capsular exopolysaccharide family [Puniceibacterium sediminis]